MSAAPLGGWPVMGMSGHDPDTSAAYAAGQAILAGRFDRDLETLRRAIAARQTLIAARQTLVGTGNPTQPRADG